jgi:hypothetical protein
MALLSVIGGLADRARSGPPTVNARPAAAVDYFLKLDGITGNAKNAFLKLELKILKLDSALASAEHKLTSSFYDKHKSDSLYLKQSDARHNYLKIRTAEAEFLKFREGDTRYLKANGVAADSSKLGGMTPDQFAHGQIFSGAQTMIAGGQSIELLPAVSPIGVKLEFNAVSQLFACTFENRTSVSMDLLGLNEKISGPDTVPAGGTKTFACPQPPSESTFQFFPSSGAGPIVTLHFGNEASVPGAANTERFVAQVLIGL